jgi:hypothetical protein
MASSIYSLLNKYMSFSLYRYFRFDMAEPLLEDCVKERQNSFGDDHQSTQIALEILNEFTIAKRQHSVQSRKNTL